MTRDGNKPPRGEKSQEPRAKSQETRDQMRAAQARIAQAGVCHSETGLRYA